MNELYDDALSYILSFCPMKKVNSVCKKWRKLSLKNSQSRVINIRLYGKKQLKRSGVNFFNEFLITLDNYKGKYDTIIMTHVFQKKYIDMLFDNLPNFKPKNLLLDFNLSINKDTLFSNISRFETLTLVECQISVVGNTSLPKNLYLCGDCCVYTSGKCDIGVDRLICKGEYRKLIHIFYNLVKKLKRLKNIEVICTDRKLDSTDYIVFKTSLFDLPNDISLEIDGECMSDELKTYLQDGIRC